MFHSFNSVRFMTTRYAMKKPIPCPTAVYNYNQFMGGVDLVDQNLSYYSLTLRRTIKWWKKVFWRLIDISIINSWIIFRFKEKCLPVSHLSGLITLRPLCDCKTLGHSGLALRFSNGCTNCFMNSSLNSLWDLILLFG